MQPEFPYQIVTFLGNEPEQNEPVYYGQHGWYPQLALKRRFKLHDMDEEGLTKKLRKYFSQASQLEIITGTLVKPAHMPVNVIDVVNQNTLKSLHIGLINHLTSNIVSRYPEREKENYYAHITAEYGGTFVIPINEYTDRTFPFSNIWLLKDVADENSRAFAKIL